MTVAADPTPLVPEPVSATTPRPLRLPVLRQAWRDLTFVHWAVPPSAVAPYLPAGTRPDTFEGRAYVGLIPFRMVGSALAGGPAVPYLGSFLETNVRVYSVDDRGRRGIVFRSLDADRLAVVLGARAVLGLPYVWSRMSLTTDVERRTLTYTAQRRTRGGPGRRPPHSRVVVRTADAVRDPSPLEHWLTARWGLHTRRLGRTAYLTNQHPAWPLHRAELVECQDALVAVGGFPGLVDRLPDSVLWSPGVEAAFGPAREH